MIGQRTRWEKGKGRFHRSVRCMIMIKRIQRKMHLKIPQRGPTLDERNRRIERSAMTYGAVMTRRETIGVAKKTIVEFLRGANRRVHQPKLRFALHKSYIVDIQRRFRFIREFIKSQAEALAKGALELADSFRERLVRVGMIPNLA